MASEGEQIIHLEKETLKKFAAVAGSTPPQPVKQAVAEIQKHAKEHAKMNAPIDTGALRESIDVDVQQERGVISFTFTSNVDYVIKTHEEQYRLGPKSAAQPSTPEGGVGNKYFTRVVDKWGEDYMNALVVAAMKSFD